MFLLILAFIAIVLLVMAIRIAQEYQRAVVFRLGRYHKTKGPGIYLIIPFIDR